MIKIKNSQKKIKLDVQFIKKFCQQALDILKYADFDLGILFATPKVIQKYNKEYRGKDKPTDVLSFSYHTNLKPGKRIRPETEEDKNLGDLIICPEYVDSDSKKFNVTFEDRLKLILVHGICHLLGYDHENDKDYRQMRAKEVFILKKLEQL
ncbi:rRNA maturation RNase YbeY [Candidatus Dependentiae bacterium]|nr:rRNA maturation RNase YbeY [Candidatus Dependentiae bacterium]